MNRPGTYESVTLSHVFGMGGRQHLLVICWHKHRRAGSASASEFNGHMKSAELGTSLQEARDILGLPPAQDPAPVLDAEPDLETMEGLCGDPIFMDTSAERYPVYIRGTGDWTPGRIVARFRYLVRILERLRVLARGRTTRERGSSTSTTL